MSLYGELKRRNVFRVATAYIIGAWIIIQVVETISPAFGFGDAAVRTVVIVLAVVFVPAIVFSWVFEITPEGLKREVQVTREHSITRFTGKKLDRIIMVLLALALSYFAIDKFVLEPVRIDQIIERTSQRARAEALVASDGAKSIAVLPFADMSAEGDQEYFSDGLSEELLNLLAKVPELRVISRSSAFSFKGKQIEIPEIAERLNVVHILQGSVRKAGSQIRVTAQLIDARTDTNMWSETYDRELSNIFDVQDSIAEEVVRELKLNLIGSAPKSRETTPEAFSTFLQAEHLLQQSSSESLKEAVLLYRKVLSIDPKYDRAWGGLGVAYSRMESLRLITAEESRALTIEAARKALEINPESAPSHSMLAMRLLKDGADFREVAYHFESALRLEPTSTAIIGNTAHFLVQIGRSSLALALVEYQVSRDPANFVAHNNLGINYRFNWRLNEAEKTLLTAISLSPTSGGVYYELGVARLQDKNFAGAVDAFSQEPIEVFRNLGLAMAYKKLGDDSKSQGLLRELIESFGEKIGYYIAQVFAFNGDLDSAFEWLEKARLSGDREVRGALVEPLFTNLHHDQRWSRFLEKTGQSPQHLALIKFDIELPN